MQIVLPLAAPAAPAPVVPPVQNAPIIPPVQNVPEVPVNRPRKTRGVTKGVKAPKAGHEKVLVTVLKRTLQPAKATSKIGPIFRRSCNEVRTHWWQWKVEDDLLDPVWAEYLRYFRFASPSEETRGRRVWEYIAAQNYPKYLHEWKRNAIKAHGSIAAARNHTPKWTIDRVWHGLCDYWMSPAFLASSLKHKLNRSSKKNIPHTSGRIPYEQVDLQLYDRLGRPPTQIERFTETHIRKRKNNDNDEMIWVTKEAEQLEEVYAKELRQANGLDSTTPVNAILHPGCEVVLDPGCKTWAATVGGVQKGRLFGRPREKWQKRSSSASSVDYAAYSDSQSARDEMLKLKKKMEDQTTFYANMFTTLGPILAELTERCGMAPFEFPTFPNDSTPISDGASNIPTNESPLDDAGDGDDMQLAM